MSIVTRTGDEGTTGLMYNRRVSKSHPQVEAYGCVDELSSCLGLARAQIPDPQLQTTLLGVQKDLITLMGELATAPEDRARYAADGFASVGPDMTEKLEHWVSEFEPKLGRLQGWALPGATIPSAALEVARTVCRRAERKIVALKEQGQLHNPEVIVYLNRLADTLWLMARWVEKL